MGFKLGQDIIDLIRGKKIVNPCSFDFKSTVNTQIYTGDNEENSALHEAYKNHKGNVSIKWEQYLSIYNRIFQRYINLGLPIKTLEIGIMNGGFLEILKRVLPEGSEVSGIDINPECKNIEFTEDVNLMIGNLLDRTFYEQNLKNKKYDIIIDDASHICKNTIETFEQMFQNLEYGGVYIIEDCHTSYWKPVYNGGYKNKASIIEYFKNLIDSLNFVYIKKEECHKKEYEKLKNYNKEIASISFYDSVIVVEKYTKPKNMPFRNLLSGELSTVVDKKSIVEEYSVIECDENANFEKFYK